jgi:hypothetical protein
MFNELPNQLYKACATVNTNIFYLAKVNDEVSLHCTVYADWLVTFEVSLDEPLSTGS